MSAQKSAMSAQKSVQEQSWAEAQREPDSDDEDVEDVPSILLCNLAVTEHDTKHVLEYFQAFKPLSAVVRRSFVRGNATEDLLLQFGGEHARDQVLSALHLCSSPLLVAPPASLLLLSHGEGWPIAVICTAFFYAWKNSERDVETGSMQSDAVGDL